MRRFFSVFLSVLLCAGLLCGCGGGGTAGGSSIKRKSYTSAERQFTAPAAGDTIAVFDTTAGEIRAVLYPDLAPQACENFITLAQSGHYDGTTFYRVEEGFVVEGGLSADGGSTTAWGGSGYPAETTDALHHYSGALCAAMDESGAGGSVFYFMQTLPQAPAQELLTAMTEAGYRQEVLDAYTAVGGAPYLDYTDTVFGQVYEGMSVVDDIAALMTAAAADSAAASGPDAAPAVTLNSVTITTYEGK